MLRAIVTATSLVLSLPAYAETLRQFHAETSTPLSELAVALERRLPKNMVAPLGEDTVFVSYSGNRIPAVLAGFLESSFEKLSPETFAVGKTISLSLTLQGDTTGTVMSLMVMGNFPASRVSLLKDSLMMMDGSGPGKCTGQMVLSHPKRAEETAKDYVDALKNDGFAFPDTEPDEVSFFIGHAPDCQIAMYLHPEQDTTMVVIRYLED